MLPATFLALCAVAVAAPLPDRQAVPFIDINASNNKIDIPVNVLGLQTHDVSAANGNLSPNRASEPAAAVASPAAPAPVAQAPAAQDPAPAAADAQPGKGINGNTVTVPVNVLGAQTHDISAFNGNLSPNQASAPAAAASPAAPAPAAQDPAPAAADAQPGKGINGNTVTVPVNVLGLQTHDVSAFNGNLSPNQAAPAPANQAAPVTQARPVTVAQANTKAQAQPQAAGYASANGSYVVPTAVNVAPAAAAVAAPNVLMGAVSGLTSALYNLAGAITGATGGRA